MKNFKSSQLPTFYSKQAFYFKWGITETFDPHPTEGTLLRTEVNDDDDDADVDFSDLSAFD